MSQPNLKVDEFLNKTTKWKEELNALRRLMLGTPLQEEFKWYAPCYQFNSKNVVILGGFKEFFVISFFKGALLKDSYGILSKPGENTQSARIIKMTSFEEVNKYSSSIIEYVKEAIEIEKSGQKVIHEDKKDSEYPMELQKRFQELPELHEAFIKLTPGRQKAYLLYFSGAKQSSTRLARIDKYISKILNGIGIND